MYRFHCFYSKIPFFKSREKWATPSSQASVQSCSKTMYIIYLLRIFLSRGDVKCQKPRHLGGGFFISQKLFSLEETSGPLGGVVFHSSELDEEDHAILMGSASPHGVRNCTTSRHQRTTFILIFKNKNRK